MTKTLKITSLIPAFILTAFLLMSVLVAFPASAQEIKESCTLTRNITIEGKSLAKNAVVKNGPASVKTLTVSGAETEYAIKEWGTVCLINTINSVTDWAFFILISVAFVFILFAGFMWMTGQGDAEKQKKAGQMIAAALVGIVIAILARVIPAVITGILT